MTVAPTIRSSREEAADLCTGDRMTRDEFHRVYQKTPQGLKAELIGGIVYVAWPLRHQHGSPHLRLGTLFGLYMTHTPGTDAADNTTVLLGPEGEPQPDLLLRIEQSSGGQSWITPDDYIGGPPELVAEVALSSRSIDLHAKYEDYRRYGVKEYVVLVLRDQRLRFFDLVGNEEKSPDADGNFRSREFPGLWLNTIAIAANDFVRAIAVLNEGLASPEHAAFVERLRTAGAR